MPKHELPVHVLFICSRNQWRSPTGERLYRKTANIVVRSAGTSRAARRQVALKDIQWAHVIFVMEAKHKTRLMAEFRQDIQYKTVHVLDIPDDYQFMDPELVAELTAKTEPVLNALTKL